MGGFNFFLCSELEKPLPKREYNIFKSLAVTVLCFTVQRLVNQGTIVATVSDKIVETFSSNGVSLFPSIKVGVSNSGRTLHGGDVGERLYLFIFLSWQNVREVLI